ncbi:hypothetical protein ABAC460_20485 [Asticcacaulis sp. AC460]|uniref:sensor histidine kinase n=1 Tax=Asticcacaulis sp. AC460 TaxID=1282360 RepID=UPI0003C3E11A|nr:ATP-binding protein [Asticcacaulis sp. AC460]ESQ87151.1 hypothetical protein ABAC460_20485 [Asticcacaulis sp. AC460]
MNHDMATFMPHGYCFLWKPGILWLHVLSDLGIAVAYFGIPLVLWYFVRKRKDLPFQLVFLLFAAFILLCGTTHLFNIWVLWNPDYYAEGAIKAATAIVSLATLGVTMRLIPQALGLPSPAQLKEANAKLEEANLKLEALYRQVEEEGRVVLGSVVNNVGEGIITLDETGRIESFNAACEAIFGYEPDDISGQPLSVLVPDAEDRHRVWLAVGASGQEVQARRKDGTVFPADLSITPFEVAGKRHHTGIIRDITRIRQAEESRHRLLTRLTESNTELERFAYVASHDMQEPLRMVMNFSQIIAKDYHDKLDDEGREYLKIVADSAHRMRDMVQDLLDYARLGREGVRSGEVDLMVELQHVQDNLATLLSESQAEISCVSLPKIRGNAVQIMRLMQNLIANSVKYQPKGQTPRIHIYASDEGDNWLIAFKDNGLGIEPGFVEQVFEPFRRLHTWDAIRGTGLGLAVCRKIVENHGGRIWAESEPGKGSTFLFTLPKTKA